MGNQIGNESDRSYGALVEPKT